MPQRSPELIVPVADTAPSFYIDKPTSSPDDIASMVELYCKDAALTYKNLVPNDADAARCIDNYFAKEADEVADDLDYPGLLPYWVMRRAEDRRLIGMAGYSVDDELIHSVYMADAYRGQGLGKLLLRHLLHEIPNPQPTLMVATGNAASVGFYRKLGFTFTGVTRQWHVSKRHTLDEAEMLAPLRR